MSRCCSRVEPANGNRCLKHNLRQWTTSLIDLIFCWTSKFSLSESVSEIILLFDLSLILDWILAEQNCKVYEWRHPLYDHKICRVELSCVGFNVALDVLYIIWQIFQANTSLLQNTQTKQQYKTKHKNLNVCARKLLTHEQTKLENCWFYPSLPCLTLPLGGNPL